VIIINPGLGPVTYSEKGQTLGGGERRVLAELDSIGQRAVELGHLLRETGEQPKDSKRAETKASGKPEAKPAQDSGAGSARRAEKS
jgi:hypothetical protein